MRGWPILFFRLSLRTYGTTLIAAFIDERNESDPLSTPHS
jgi:hypothetical protein